MKKFSRDIQHYLPLVGILVAGLVGFIVFSYDRNFQVAIAVAVAISYVVWGLVHHHIHKDLHASVVIEYLAIAVIGLVAVFSVLFRA
jgi:EamA domain-containing membrane protein RarD